MPSKIHPSFLRFSKTTSDVQVAEKMSHKRHGKKKIYLDIDEELKVRFFTESKCIIKQYFYSVLVVFCVLRVFLRRRYVQEQKYRMCGNFCDLKKIKQIESPKITLKCAFV